MKNTHIVAILLGAVLVTSGCLDALEDEDVPVDQEDDLEEELLDEEVTEEETETEEETTEEETTEETQEQDEETEEASDENGVDTKITISGFGDNSYNTEEVEVEEGETVEFIYAHEGGQHDLVLERDGEDVERTEVISEPGLTDSFTYTFEQEGEYQFYCSEGTHRAQGMEGNIEVS